VHREDHAAGVERGEDLDQLIPGEPRAVGIVRPDVGVRVEKGGARQIVEQGLEPRLQQRFVDRGGQGAQSRVRAWRRPR